MKFMNTWKLLPGSEKAAVDRFLEFGGDEPKGATLLGRWHSVNCRSGFTLYETSDPAALHLAVAKWVDLLESNIVPVIEDGEAGPNLATVFKK